MNLQSKYKAWISKLLVVSFMIFIVGESRFSYSNVGNLTPTHTATGTPTITPTPTLDPWMTVTATQTHTPSTPTLTPTITPIPTPTPDFSACWFGCMENNWDNPWDIALELVVGCFGGILQLVTGQCPNWNITTIRNCIKGTGVQIVLVAEVIELGSSPKSMGTN